MSEPRPLLLVLIPADWEAIPEGLAELRRCLAEDYGATLLLRPSRASLRSPMPHYVGYWTRWARRNARWSIPPLVEAAFFSLDWLVVEDVG